MSQEISRFIIVGIIATVVHYAILTFNINTLHMSSAGEANFFASLFGISTAFLGNKYFTFTSAVKPITKQATKFIGVYIIIAGAHGIILHMWTDIFHLDYRAGFLIATAIQAILSYISSKFLVFTS